MDYKYQEHFFKTYQNLLKQSYTKENRTVKAKKIVRILKKHIHEHRLAPLKQRKALDIGCSVGHMTAYLAPYVYEMTGMDIDADAVKEAKEHYRSIANLRYIVADSMKLPFADESFDLVICTQVYEHVPDSVQLMREIARILVRGGGYATLQRPSASY